MTAADDAGIFAAADPVYQQNISFKASSAQFDNVRNRLGAPGSSQSIDSNSADLPSLGTFLTVRYRTDFANGQGRETIRLHRDGGAWKLAAYSVDSPLLQPVKTPPPFRLNLK